MPFRRRMDPKKLKNAKRMRAHPTAAEKALWSNLSDTKTWGIRFRRQAPMLGYIADFYCARAKLVIEVDGPCHSEHLESDRRRDMHLAARGIHTLRFSNDQVLKNRPYVLNTIRVAVDELRLTLPSRSRAGGRSMEPSERSLSRGDAGVSRQA